MMDRRVQFVSVLSREPKTPAVFRTKLCDDFRPIASDDGGLGGIEDNLDIAGYVFQTSPNESDVCSREDLVLTLAPALDDLNRECTGDGSAGMYGLDLRFPLERFEHLRATFREFLGLGHPPHLSLTHGGCITGSDQALVELRIPWRQELFRLLGYLHDDSTAIEACVMKRMQDCQRPVCGNRTIHVQGPFDRVEFAHDGMARALLNQESRYHRLKFFLEVSVGQKRSFGDAWGISFAPLSIKIEDGYQSNAIRIRNNNNCSAARGDLVGPRRDGDLSQRSIERETTHLVEFTLDLALMVVIACDLSARCRNVRADRSLAVLARRLARFWRLPLPTVGQCRHRNYSRHRSQYRNWKPRHPAGSVARCPRQFDTRSAQSHEKCAVSAPESSDSRSVFPCLTSSR